MAKKILVQLALFFVLFIDIVISIIFLLSIYYPQFDKCNNQGKFMAACNQFTILGYAFWTSLFFSIIFLFALAKLNKGDTKTIATLIYWIAIALSPLLLMIAFIVLRTYNP